jgi:voltage-gated potassium channel
MSYRLNNQLNPLFIAGTLLILSILTGTFYFHLAEDFEMVDAFYMSVITISTVGFFEVKELSVEGRIFTAVYIICNMAILAFVISIFSSYLFEGRLRTVFRKYMIDREINKLKDHVIVCGYGRNGRKACEELTEDGMKFVVIDRNEALLSNYDKVKGFHLVLGDATHDETLKAANVALAKNMIITTPSDADNVFITLSAKELNPNIHVIVRATYPESVSKLERAKADQIIMPEEISGTIMAQMITKPEVIEFLNLLTGQGANNERYMMETIRYDELKSNFQDKTLGDLEIFKKTGSIVIGVKDDIKGIIPNPNPSTLIGQDDCIILFGTSDVLSNARQVFTKFNISS